MEELTPARASGEPVLAPIARDDLPEVGRFLTENLNRRIPPEQWAASVTHEWCSARPNYGMKLTADGRLVGVFLAIYSDQVIRGQSERVCNPHTWCVLKEYRARAVGLAAALVKQPGYHFSMLTPNPNVDAVFRFMKFRELDKRVCIFPNLPGVGRGTVTDVPAEMRRQLAGSDLADYDRHAAIPWLRHFVLTGADGRACWVVHKPRVWKRLPCADLLHVSDPAVFRAHLATVRNYLLFRCRMAWGRIETRFVGAPLPLSLARERTQPKLFLSPTLADGDVRDLYSELVSLDI